LTSRARVGAVERRIQENETAIGSLEQSLDLHALDPAPADLETRSAVSVHDGATSGSESRLAGALGSAEAASLAKEKLNAAEAELAAVEKISRAPGASLKRATGN